MINDKPKLKRAVLYEEYITLLGDVNEAVVLAQMVYWQSRVRDVKKFIDAENRARIQNNETVIQIDGWIFKSAKELSGEILVAGEKTVERRLKSLVEKKLLLSRRNPKYKWDKTLQYVVNLDKLENDLISLGYSGIPNFEYKPYEANVQAVEAIRQIDASIRHVDAAIPETTTETTPQLSTKYTKSLDTKTSDVAKHSLETAEVELVAKTSDPFLSSSLIRPLPQEVSIKETVETKNLVYEVPLRIQGSKVTSPRSYKFPTGFKWTRPNTLGGKTSMAELTDLEIWELAWELQMPFVDQLKRKYIEEIKPHISINKYGHTSTYQMLREWAQRDLNRGMMDAQYEVGYQALLKPEHPANVAHRNFLFLQLN